MRTRTLSNDDYHAHVIAARPVCKMSPDFPRCSQVAKIAYLLSTRSRSQHKMFLHWIIDRFTRDLSRVHRQFVETRALVEQFATMRAATVAAECRAKRTSISRFGSTSPVIGYAVYFNYTRKKSQTIAGPRKEQSS